MVLCVPLYYQKKKKKMLSVIFLNSLLLPQWAMGITWKKDYWKVLPTVCNSMCQKNLIQDKLCL